MFIVDTANVHNDTIFVSKEVLVDEMTRITKKVGALTTCLKEIGPEELEKFSLDSLEEYFQSQEGCPELIQLLEDLVAPSN